MQVASTPESITPINVGDVIPNSYLVGMDGKELSLHEITHGHAAVIIFYRGSW